MVSGSLACDRACSDGWEEVIPNLRTVSVPDNGTQRQIGLSPNAHSSPVLPHHHHSAVSSLQHSLNLKLMLGLEVWIF